MAIGANGQIAAQASRGTAEIDAYQGDKHEEKSNTGAEAHKFEVAKKDIRLNGLQLTVDEVSGRALSVERVAVSCN